MPSIPSAVRHTAALSMHNAALEPLGRGFQPGTIKVGANSYAASIWSHDPQRPVLLAGGLDLPERIIFTIPKATLPAAIAHGAIVIWQEMNRAYAIDRIDQEGSAAASWQFEARRAPGGDP